jgi:hypothetical protein
MRQKAKARGPCLKSRKSKQLQRRTIRMVSTFPQRLLIPVEIVLVRALITGCRSLAVVRATPVFPNGF